MINGVNIRRLIRRVKDESQNLYPNNVHHKGVMDMRRIAILTSGGDAPGMNAAIRAITRKAIHEGLSVYGIERGFEGIINSEIRPFTRS